MAGSLLRRGRECCQEMPSLFLCAKDQRHVLPRSPCLFSTRPLIYSSCTKSRTRRNLRCDGAAAWGLSLSVRSCMGPGNACAFCVDGGGMVPKWFVGQKTSLLLQESTFRLHWGFGGNNISWHGHKHMHPGLSGLGLGVHVHIYAR